jgi:hypothetical protein
MSGNAELTSALSTYKENGKNISSHIDTVDVVVNNDFYFCNSKFTFSPGIYYTDNSVYNSIVKDDVTKMKAIYLNELYYTYNIFKDVSVSVGLFPFRKGTLYEMAYNGTRLGNGLYNVNDVTMQGIILTYKPTKEHTLSGGKINFDKYFKSFYDYDASSGPVSYDSYKNTGGYFIIDKHQLDNLYLEVNYYKIEQVINSNPIIASDILGGAFTYSDEENTGFTYYGSVVLTKSSGDNEQLSPTKKPFEDDGYYFGGYDTAGYSITAGFKKEVDDVIWNKDMSFGIEYAYKSPGYHSLLAGKPISLLSYADIGTTINASIGVSLNKDNLLKLRYCHYDSDGVSTYKGFTPEYGNNDTIKDSVTSSSSIMLQWYSDF